MLNLPNHDVIDTARGIVQVCLEEIAAEGKLQEVAERQDDFVGQIAIGLLADCLKHNLLNLEMIERWTQETVAQLHHIHHRCACGHLLHSSRERTELQCMECRLVLLIDGFSWRKVSDVEMVQEMLPYTRVRVITPATEHQNYLNARGRILDVRDFDNHRFCQVELDGQSIEPLWFEATELIVE